MTVLTWERHPSVSQAPHASSPTPPPPTSSTPAMRPPSLLFRRLFKGLAGQIQVLILVRFINMQNHARPQDFLRLRAQALAILALMIRMRPALKGAMLR